MATHYQTCFYVRYAPDVYHRHPVFHSIQNRLMLWVMGKEKVARNWASRDEFQKAFTRQSEYTFPSKNTCVTDCHKEVFETRTRVDMWAMCYTEYKQDQNWITEVGIRRIDYETCLVHVKVSFTLGRFAIGSQTSPLPSVPRFITQLIEDGRHFLFLANEEDASVLPIQTGFLSVSSAKALSLLYDRLIFSCLRSYVIIVANGDFKAKNVAQRLYNGIKVDDRYVSHGVRSKALVVYLEKCDENKEALEDIPLEYRVPFNHVRVFYPVDESSNDRILSCDTMEENRIAVVSSLLSAFVLDNNKAVKTPETVKHFNALSLAHEQIKKHEAAQPTDTAEGESVEDLKELIDELFKELDCNQKEHAKKLAKQVQETKRYMDRADALTKTVEDKKRELTSAYNQNKTLAALAYPGSLADIMSFFAALFPQRIVVHENAYAAARKYKTFKEFSRAWDLMSALATTLYKMKFEGDGMINEAAFKDATGFELSMTEGKMTKKAPKLDALRKTKYSGKVYDTYPHLKWSSKPPKCLRLHFAFIEEEKKILIGYFGEHLDNYSTAKM